MHQVAVAIVLGVMCGYYTFAAPLQQYQKEKGTFDRDATEKSETGLESSASQSDSKQS